MNQVEEVITERTRMYGQAWKDTGLMVTPVEEALSKFTSAFPEGFYPWVIILNKLVRLLADPRNKDSWKDIAGYATLVLNYLDKEVQDGSVHTSRPE